MKCTVIMTNGSRWDLHPDAIPFVHEAGMDNVATVEGRAPGLSHEAAAEYGYWHLMGSQVVAYRFEDDSDL